MNKEEKSKCSPRARSAECFPYLLLKTKLKSTTTKNEKYFSFNIIKKGLSISRTLKLQSFNTYLIGAHDHKNKEVFLVGFRSGIKYIAISTYFTFEWHLKCIMTPPPPELNDYLLKRFEKILRTFSTSFKHPCE